MIAGKDAIHHGEAKNSWLTGTAAWTFVNISQYILGIQPDYAGLKINPCIPSDLEELTIRRFFRNAWYYITIKNPNHVETGISSMIVDGYPINGNLVPVKDGKTEYRITVTMGTPKCTSAED